jgi:hypothetical protein
MPDVPFPQEPPPLPPAPVGARTPPPAPAATPSKDAGAVPSPAPSAGPRLMAAPAPAPAPFNGPPKGPTAVPAPAVSAAAIPRPPAAPPAAVSAPSAQAPPPAAVTHPKAPLPNILRPEAKPAQAPVSRGASRAMCAFHPPPLLASTAASIADWVGVLTGVTGHDPEAPGSPPGSQPGGEGGGAAVGGQAGRCAHGRDGAGTALGPARRQPGRHGHDAAHVSAC